MPRIVLLLLALALPQAVSLAAQSNDVIIVVNAANPVSSMTASEISSLFLKRTTRWPDGGKVAPIDQTPRSDVRERFNELIHDKDLDWVESYWNKMIFSGRASAPPTAPNDRDVIGFVRGNANAIGYVSAGTPLGNGVKALTIEG